MPSLSPRHIFLSGWLLLQQQQIYAKASMFNTGTMFLMILKKKGLIEVIFKGSLKTLPWLTANIKDMGKIAQMKKKLCNHKQNLNRI